MYAAIFIFKTIGDIWLGAYVLLFTAFICVETDVCICNKCMGSQPWQLFVGQPCVDAVVNHDCVVFCTLSGS